jgi:geranylgeranyl diphosphate synthase, type II
LSGDLRRLLQTKKDAIDAALRTMIDRYAQGVPPILADAIRYSLLAPGKRLRPILALLACEAAGGSDEQATPAACAVEMVHTYSLIHDDLPAMDDDDLRRGMPTSHKKYGEALAILAGDGLLTLAFQVLAESYPPESAAVSCLELARGAGIAGMVGGQVLDLAAEGKIAADQVGQTFLSAGSEIGRQESLPQLEAIHRLKTGSLFNASLRLGLLASRTECQSVLATRMDTYGRAFGLAFQIADDLLDVEGSSERTGKRVGKDTRRGKLTYPQLLGVNESRQRAHRLVQEAVAAVADLGEAGEYLAALVRYVMERDK